MVFLPSDFLHFTLDFVAVLTGLFFLVKSGLHLTSGDYNMLHVCLVVFFVMQALPIAVGWFGDLGAIRAYYPFMFKAMTDVTTGIIYDLFVIVTVALLYWFSCRFPRYRPFSISDWVNKVKAFRGLTVLIGMLTVFPIIVGVLLAPDPSVYLQFSYFNINLDIKSSVSFIYDDVVMHLLTYVAFFSTLVSYYCSDSRSKIQYVIPVLLITWINGKRTLLLFLLIGFVIIDYLKWDRNDRVYIKVLARKALLFFGFYIGYYIVYNLITQKADFADNSLLYTVYFSRLCNVKVAIYDLLYTNSMLDYPMQSILYNLLFFVPRSIWPGKPYGYYPYFTSYVFSGVGWNTIKGYGFQVNLWSEFISNAGFLGLFLAIGFVVAVIHIAEKSQSVVSYISGTAFIVLYFAYGFEHIVQMLWILFIISLFFSWIFKRPEVVESNPRGMEDAPPGSPLTRQPYPRLDSRKKLRQI